MSMRSTSLLALLCAASLLQGSAHAQTATQQTSASAATVDTVATTGAAQATTGTTPTVGEAPSTTSTAAAATAQPGVKAQPVAMAKARPLITPATSPAHWSKDGSLGWFVIASSIFIGAAVTGFGLAQTCPEGVNSCTRSTSLAIWGGIGGATLGTILGLVMVQQGHARQTGQNVSVLRLGPLGEFALLPAPAAPTSH